MTPASAGSSPATPAIMRHLAQQAEPTGLARRDSGSNPEGRTILWEAPKVVVSEYAGSTPTTFSKEEV